MKKIRNMVMCIAMALGVFCGALFIGKVDVEAETVVSFVTQNDGSMRYYENGEWVKTKNGYADYNGGKFFVVNGVLATSANGLVQDPAKVQDWYYLANGMAQTQYTGLAQYDGAWFYISAGKLDTTMSACVNYDGGLFYVAAGRIVKEKNGLGQDPRGTTWYYFAEGMVQKQYTGLALYDGHWFYVENGIFINTYTGYAVYNGACFYVQNGEMVRQEYGMIANNYPKQNMFANSYDIKGLQGATSATQSKYGGLKHSLINVVLNDCIFSPSSSQITSSSVVPFQFEGETFYFRKNPISIASDINDSGMSLSVVFLIRWSNSTSFLIDEGSRVQGYTYYAPNTNMNSYGGKAIRAFWHYLMSWLEEKGYHIDNFILGNEVNMPNHWHYSGSTDVNVVAAKYADAFYYMYDAVRKYTTVSRCSISIDHCWNHNDEGRGIGARSFLHKFNERVSSHGRAVDWCVSAHLYPALLTDSRIWKHPYNLTTKNSNSPMVDGTNLSVMTNYIRDNFGSQHRIMLTEQGFTNYYGQEAQAASLAYSYYAAMYDPMVDSFLLNVENAGNQLDFGIDGSLAQTVYTKIGNGNAADQQWIANLCLPVIGASSWGQIVPNFGR